MSAFIIFWRASEPLIVFFLTCVQRVPWSGFRMANPASVQLTRLFSDLHVLLVPLLGDFTHPECLVDRPVELN
jgi:hypothetical protein